MNYTNQRCRTKSTIPSLVSILAGLVLLASSQAVASAAQSAILTNNRIATFNVPSSSPYNALGSTRLEVRIHDWTLPSTGFLVVFSNAGFAVRLMANGELCASNTIDALNDYSGTMCGDVTGQNDVILRTNRNLAQNQFSLSISSANTSWKAVTYCGTKTNGTNINRFSCPITTVNLLTWAGPGSIGGGQGEAKIAWVKWHSTLNTTESIPASYDAADLGDWRFEGNGSEVNNRMNASMSSIGYGATPVYQPLVKVTTLNAPDWSDWVSIRAGHPAIFDGSKSLSFTDNAPTTFRWQEVDMGSNPPLILDNWSSPVLQIRGAVFGTYSLKLTVTDDAGNSGESVLTFGSVAMDSNGVIVNANPTVDAIFGPMIAFGKNPWPWADSRHKYLSEFFGDKLDTDPDFADTWNQPLAGTISVTTGSTTVTGIGTSFNTSYACNGTDRIVVHYPRASGGTGRFVTAIASCGSETSMTLAVPYTKSATANGLSYSKYPNANEFFYANGGNNINYYDNVLAHYALYFRSGNSKYRDYARKLAYRWWTSPSMDRGLTGLLPRLLSPLGLVTCMVVDDCASYDPVFQSFWADFEAGLENWEVFIKNDWWPGDGREESYRSLTHSLGAKFDPTPAKAARYLSDISTGLALKYSPRQQSSGTIYTPLDAPGPSNVDVISGSRTVTARSSFTFQGIFCSASTYVPLVIFGGTAFENVAYKCTWNSATQITLDRPYIGVTGARFAKSNNIVGQGTQPFILGVFANYFRFHNLATNTTAATNLLTGTTDWLTRFGLNPVNKGLFYGREFPGCEPPTALVNCLNGGTDIGDDGARFFAAETMGAWSWSYLAAPTAARRDRGDLHYGANYGKLGGPQAAERYSYSALDDNGFVVSTRKAKDYGFAFGFGFSSTWPAAREGGVKPARPVASTVSADFGDAASIRVTIIEPSGQTSVQTCQPSDTCQVTLDARQGSHWRKIEFLDGDGVLIPDRTVNEQIDLP